VDLSLPDATGLEALEQVLAMAPDTAVLVLTGLADAHVGIEAVAAGAEDFLVKQDVDGRLLSRAIRYAIERKPADVAMRELVEERIIGQENSRLALRPAMSAPRLSTAISPRSTSSTSPRSGRRWARSRPSSTACTISAGPSCTTGGAPSTSRSGRSWAPSWSR
jgi:DNA-binding NarL/FixJ family response regulator